MTTPPPPAADLDATRLALRVLGLGLLARLLLAVLVDPGLDEAYAMAVSRQWQLSWFDHPPMTFWWVAAARDLARPLVGDAVPAAVLRLPFVLAFTATSWLLFDLTRRLWGARAGLWALLALTLAPFFLVSAGGWMVPDGPLLLFLVATARLLVEILVVDGDRARASRLWLAAGLTLGLAGLSKYHAVLFALGALGFLLATPRRRHLATPAPWAAAVLAALVVLPVLLWNADNDWASFRFQSSRGLGGSPDWRGFGRALLGQLAWLAPWTLIGAVWATARARATDRRVTNRRAPADASLFLLAVAILPIVVFTAIPLLGGDALPHWQMPGWIFLLPLLGRALAEAEAEGTALPRLARRFAAAAAILLGLAAGLVGLVRLVPPGHALVERLRLGRALAEATTWVGLPRALAARGLLAPDAAGRPPLVVSPRWLEAARLGEVLGARATVAVWDGDPRGFAFLADPRDAVGRDALLVARPETAPRLDAYAPLFERLDPPIALAVGRGADPAIDLVVVVAHRLRAPYPLPYPKR